MTIEHVPSVSTVFLVMAGPPLAILAIGVFVIARFCPRRELGFGCHAVAGQVVNTSSSAISDESRGKETELDLLREENVAHQKYLTPLHQRLTDAETALRIYDAGATSEYWVRHPYALSPRPEPTSASSVLGVEHRPWLKPDGRIG